MGKMKQRKRKPKGAAVREKESRARAAESSQTAREGGAFQLSYQRGELREKVRAQHKLFIHFWTLLAQVSVFAKISVFIEN